MTLLLIIIVLVLFTILATKIFNKKTSKILIIISILSVITFFLFLSVCFFSNKQFFPTKDIQIYYPCGNFYNLLSNSLIHCKTNILEDIDNSLINSTAIYYKYSDDISMLLDTSVYKGKIYLYFGITPVILFYLPFNLITHLYLTDKILVFILSCFIFLFSLLIIKKISESITDIKNIPVNIVILSIFLVGCCNLLPFLLLRSFIYEIPITTAISLLLISFYFFYCFLKTKNLTKQKILIFCLSLTLCLSVGARPHYVLFIPIFFISIIWLTYIETKNFRNILKTIIIFIIPCLIYGTIIASYNYLRFDSIFEFGWKYQLNPHNQICHIPTINDFILGLTNNFFLMPNINETTIFSLSKVFGHTLGKEYIAGIVWTCPIILILFFIPVFLKEIYKKNIDTFIFLLIMIFVILINIIVISFFGMIIRYIFEYLSLMIILSIIMFLFYISRIKDKFTKNFLNLLFTLIFIYSIFINISLLFCKENFWAYESLKDTNYSRIVKFLF